MKRRPVRSRIFVGGEWVPREEAPRRRMELNVKGVKKPIVARSLPLNHPDAPRTLPTGEAVFTSEREIREFCARAGYTWGETNGPRG